MTRHDEPMPPEKATPDYAELWMSRRDLLAGGTAVVAARALASPARTDDSTPGTPIATFFVVSQALTGLVGLASSTSDRIYVALESTDGTLS